MRLKAKFKKITINPGKPAQIVFTADQDDLVVNENLLELATIEEDSSVILSINMQQSNLPFEEVRISKNR